MDNDEIGDLSVAGAKMQDAEEHTEKTQEIKNIFDTIEEIKSTNAVLDKRYIQLAASQKEMESRFEAQQKEMEKMKHEHVEMKAKLTRMTRNETSILRLSKAQRTNSVVVRRSPRIKRQQRKRKEESERNAPNSKRRKMSKVTHITKNH